MLTLNHLGEVKAKDVLRGVLDHPDDTGDDVVEGFTTVNEERDTISVEGVDVWEVREALRVAAKRR